MTEAVELEALYASLEETPTDHVTQLALADWFEDHDQPVVAEVLRWLGQERKALFRYFHSSENLRHHHDSWKNGWYWWTTSRERRGWGYPTSAVLPHKIWKRLAHTFSYDPLVFKEYPTVRSAIETLIAAWPRPGNRRRATRS